MTVAIAGGGPGGAMLAYLLARAGIAVTLVEARPDFEREYRGDSLHPYTMELLDQLGLAAEVLQIPHVKADGFRFHTPDGVITAASYARLRTPFNYVAIMAQARLIELLLDRAAEFPGFTLRTSAKVTGLIEEDGRVVGVRHRDGETRTELVVGADGRYSAVRRHADLPLTSSGASTDPLGGPDHWRIGYAIPHGGYGAAREAGVAPIQAFLRTHVPWLADRAHLLDDFGRTSLLSVDIAAAPRWHRPGVLLIGDAAHVISPTGGNGILMAIQDAVAATNHLVGPLRRGTLAAADLAAVQAERAPAIAEVQADQSRTERAADRARARGAVLAPPRFVRPLLALPFVQRRSARANAYGPRPPKLDRASLDREQP